MQAGGPTPYDAAVQRKGELADALVQIIEASKMPGDAALFHVVRSIAAGPSFDLALLNAEAATWRGLLPKDRV